MNGPDYSQVVSPQKARELFQRGELDRILLLPEEFGGEDVPRNVVYVPPGLGEIKAGIDQQILGLAEQGLVDRYKATPRYQGRSVVPIALEILATSSSRPGSFGGMVEMWGDGLSRNRS
jgi:hypothetical protein